MLARLKPWKNIKSISSICLLFIFSTACELREPTETVTDIEIIEGTHQSDNIEDLGNACYREHYTQPESVLTDKLDILFVVDTSGSIANERIRIAHKIDKFIKKLPKDVHYRLSVLLAHGERSHWSGKLYYKGFITPRVFDSKKHSLNWIRLNLKFRLMATPIDYFSDGGETSFYSLHKATTGENLVKHQNEGMFREDAALSVIFISDENEICAEYPEGVEPAKDHDYYNGRPLEELARDENCTIEDENGEEQWLSNEYILEHLRALKKDKPVTIGAIVHTDKDPESYHISHHRSNGKNSHSRRKHSRSEDEYGYGYMELVERSNGVAIDIYDKDYTEGLSKLGQKVSVQMQVYDTFQLTHSPALADSIAAFVDNEAAVSALNADRNIVTLENPGMSNSKVAIEYCVEEIVIPPEEPPVVDPPVDPPEEPPVVDPPGEPPVEPPVVDPPEEPPVEEPPEVPPVEEIPGDLPDGCDAVSCEIEVEV